MEKEQTNENSWEFHLTDKIAQLSKMTLEMHTEFWLSTLQTWFHGYQTPEEYKATIWGREIGRGRPMHLHRSLGDTDREITYH